MLPEALSSAIDSAASQLSTEKLDEAGRELSLGYREKDRHLSPLTGEGALAYAVSRMPATYEAIRFALSCLPTEFVPSMLLDAGAGPGTGTWAVHELWPETEAVLWERDPAMRQIGTKLGVPGRYETVDLTSPPPFSAALVLCAYVLNEFSEEAAEKLALALWDRTEGALVLVDPGTPEAYARMMGIRRVLVRAGAHLIAPCPHESECMLPSGDWCHFSSRVTRSKRHKAAKGGERGFEDEKFTYLVFTRCPYTVSDRIRSRPLYGKGFVQLPLCTANGLKNVTVSKSKGSLYKAARNAEWGDRWSEGGESHE